jgi:hypothetical protein
MKRNSTADWPGEQAIQVSCGRFPRFSQTTAQRVEFRSRAAGDCSDL